MLDIFCGILYNYTTMVSGNKYVLLPQKIGGILSCHIYMHLSMENWKPMGIGYAKYSQTRYSEKPAVALCIPHTRYPAVIFCIDTSSLKWCM